MSLEQPPGRGHDPHEHMGGKKGGRDAEEEARDGEVAQALEAVAQFIGQVADGGGEERPTEPEHGPLEGRESAADVLVDSQEKAFVGRRHDRCTPALRLEGCGASAADWGLCRQPPRPRGAAPVTKMLAEHGAEGPQDVLLVARGESSALRCGADLP